MSLTNDLDRTPPFVAYAQVRDGRGKRPSFDELVRRSGLSESTFLRISKMLSYAKCRVEQADAFARACKVDLVHPSHTNVRKYMKDTITRAKTSFPHLLPRQRKRLEVKLAQYMAINVSPEEQHQS